MIQRIQSVFLLLAAAASFSLFGLPFASTDQAVAQSSLFADSLYNLMDQPALIALFGLGGLLALISIFLFRKRQLQMRMTIFAFIANLIGIVLAILFFMQNWNASGNFEVNDGPGIYPPILALILTLVARYFINKDEKLVRSMDRLR